MYNKPKMNITGKLPISGALRQRITGCLARRNKNGAKQRLKIYKLLFPYSPYILHFNPQLAKEIQRLRCLNRCNTAEALVWFLAAYLKKNRRLQTLGRRFVFSMDPVKCHQLLLAGQDPASLLMAAVERTFQDYAERYLPGDELMYVMSICHEKLTNTLDATGRRATPMAKVCVQALLFNRTSKGRRYCLSNQYSSNIRNLDNFLELYQLNVKTMVYSRPGITGNLAALNPLIAYYAWLALDDFQKAPNLETPMQMIQFALGRYQYYLSLNHDAYQQNFARLVAHLKMLCGQKYGKINIFRQNCQNNINRLAEIGQKGLIEVVDRLMKDTAPEVLQQCLNEFSCRSLGIKLQMIAEYFELALCKAAQQRQFPAWLKTLVKAKQSPSVWEDLNRQLQQGLPSNNTHSSTSRDLPNNLPQIHAEESPQAPDLR